MSSQVFQQVMEKNKNDHLQERIGNMGVLLKDAKSTTSTKRIPIVKLKKTSIGPNSTMNLDLKNNFSSASTRDLTIVPGTMSSPMRKMMKKENEKLAMAQNQLSRQSSLTKQLKTEL